MIKIGVAQIQNSTDVEANFENIKKFLTLFQEHKVDLVMFPECAISGFSAKTDENLDQKVDSILKYLIDFSTKHDVHIIAPTVLKEDAVFYNSGFHVFKGRANRFYKIGLTPSEQLHFSKPVEDTPKVLDINGYRCALLICKEAQDEAWTYFERKSADIILWPGYWGWKLDDGWKKTSHEGKENLIYSNMQNWKLPLIQANFSSNSSVNSRTSGPQGLSVVVDSTNKLKFQAAHLKETGFVTTMYRLDNECTITKVEEIL